MWGRRNRLEIAERAANACGKTEQTAIVQETRANENRSRNHAVKEHKV
jgi:hypothetical protein